MYPHVTVQKVIEVDKAMNCFYRLCLVYQGLFKAVGSAIQGAFWTQWLWVGWLYKGSSIKTILQR